MKGFKLVLPLLIAMTFAFGSIACENKEEASSEAATTAGAGEEAPPEGEGAAEAEGEEAPAEAEAGTNGAAEEGGATAGAAAAEGGEGDEPEAPAESQ